MEFSVLHLFSPTNPVKVRKEQLYEAKRLQLEYAAQAEHAAALAAMYAARIQRLEALETPVAAS